MRKSLSHSCSSHLLSTITCVFLWSCNNVLVSKLEIAQSKFHKRNLCACRHLCVIGDICLIPIICAGSKDIFTPVRILSRGHIIRNVLEIVEFWKPSLLKMRKPFWKKCICKWGKPYQGREKDAEMYSCRLLWLDWRKENVSLKFSSIQNPTNISTRSIVATPPTFSLRP